MLAANSRSPQVGAATGSGGNAVAAIARPPPSLPPQAPSNATDAPNASARASYWTPGRFAEDRDVAMYLPAHFEETRLEVLHGFVRSHPFGMLVTQAVQGMVANGIPFLLDPEGSGGFGTLRAHVARANPVWREARRDEALVLFQGPQGYVSPAWYPAKAEHGKVVPTWNYVMVQARGPLRVIEDRAWLLALVTRLTDRHEAARAAPWAVADAPAAYVESMLGAIVGIEIELTSLVGKWKMSQNRAAADRDGVVRGLAEAGDEATAALARQVANPGQADG